MEHRRRNRRWAGERDGAPERSGLRRWAGLDSGAFNRKLWASLRQDHCCRRRETEERERESNREMGGEK
jgi:hypothetical protein